MIIGDNFENKETEEVKLEEDFLVTKILMDQGITRKESNNLLAES